MTRERKTRSRHIRTTPTNPRCGAGARTCPSGLITFTGCNKTWTIAPRPKSARPTTPATDTLRRTGETSTPITVQGVLPPATRLIPEFSPHQKERPTPHENKPGFLGDAIAMLVACGWIRRIVRAVRHAEVGSVEFTTTLVDLCVWAVRPLQACNGEVSERLKELVSKTSVRVTVPGVRIPPSPILRCYFTSTYGYEKTCTSKVPAKHTFSRIKSHSAVPR